MYLLRCKGGRYYAGITTEPRRRYEQHLRGVRAGGAKFTSMYPPETMAALWQAADRAAASRLERRLKAMPHEEKTALAQGKPLPDYERSPIPEGI